MIKSFLLLGVLLSASTALSQNAEKIYSISNPYGSRMMVESLSVDDTVNFKLESLKAMPYDLDEIGTLDFKVTVTANDGITRTTQVRCNDGRCTPLYTITMAAPIASGVKGADDRAARPAYPNPVKDYCTINTDISLYPNVQIELFNSVGASVIGVVQPVGHNLSLDARNLTNGRYHLTITTNGTVIRSEDIIVNH